MRRGIFVVSNRVQQVSLAKSSKMVDEIVKLKEDLKKRLDLLVSMNERPHTHINDLFSALRNEIDCDAEKLISGDEKDSGSSDESTTSDRDEKDVKSVNETRRTFMKVLDESERKLLDKLAKWDSSVGSAKLAGIGQKIETMFKASSDDSVDGKLNDFENYYEQLVVEIVEETNRLEKCLLDGQSFIYIESEFLGSGELGCFIHLQEDYLSKEETTCLK